MEELVAVRTYLASVEITGCKDERFFRREQLSNLLYGIIESVLSKTGLEKYLDYLFIRYENHAMLRLHDRKDASEIADLATMIMLLTRHTELDGKVKVAIHHDHLIKYPDMKAEIELPCSGAQWAFAVRSTAQPGQIVLSKMLWMELSKTQRTASRLHLLTTHTSLMGMEEELYKLDWAAEQETALFASPLPKSVV